MGGQRREYPSWVETWQAIGFRWVQCKYHPIPELHQAYNSKGLPVLMKGYVNLAQFTASLNSSIEIAPNLGSFIIIIDENNCKCGGAHKA